MPSKTHIGFATEPDQNGWRYEIRYRTPCPGIGWARLDADGKVINESQGAFYDGCEDHPEGAIAWAVNSARLHRIRMLALLKDLPGQST